MESDEILKRLFRNAIAAARNGNQPELDSFGVYLDSSPSLRERLLALAQDCWCGVDDCATGGATGGATGSGGVAGVAASAVDVLAALLAVESLWRDAACLWVTCISGGGMAMPGHVSSMCISVLCNKLLSLCTASFSDNRLRETVMFLQTFPDSCLNAVMECSHFRRPDATACLELIAPCVDALALLCRRKQAQALRLLNPIGEIITACLDVGWGEHPSAYLNMLCDMHAHLTPHLVDAIKVGIFYNIGSISRISSIGRCAFIVFIVLVCRSSGLMFVLIQLLLMVYSTLHSTI
jgi:hypothetical protein